MNVIGTYQTNSSTWLRICHRAAVIVTSLFCLLVYPTHLLGADDAQQSDLNCEADYKPLIANFTIQRTIATRKRPSFASGTTNKLVGPIRSSTQQVELTREGDITKRVVHTYPDLKQSEIWNLTPNGFMRVVKHFNSHARAIEYEPVDIGSPTVDVGWNKKFNLLPGDIYKKLIESMDGEAALAENCIYQFEHAIEDQGVVIDLDWNQQLQLPEQMVVLQTAAGNRHTITEIRTTIKLTSADVNSEMVEQKFEAWRTHPTLDFADIGDNESDPFLMTMINFGFISHGASGFYDSSGEQISPYHIYQF